MKKIRCAVGSLPLVMHGGSGLPDEQFHRAVTNGINKVNYVTYMQLAAVAAMKEAIVAHEGGKYSMGDAMKVAQESMIVEAKKLFALYNTAALRQD